jgi:hypothetical protein
MSGSGNMTAQQQQQLATILANQSVGQGSQNAGFIGGAGQAQVGADLAQGANMQNLLGNLANAGGYYMGNRAPTTAAPATGGGYLPNNSGISAADFISNNQQPMWG